MMQVAVEADRRRILVVNFFHTYRLSVEEVQRVECRKDFCGRLYPALGNRLGRVGSFGYGSPEW